jgi:1,4-alpha-glucan branching enzyme
LIMNAIDEKRVGGIPVGRQAASPVHFYHHAPQAQLVELAGDFNHWRPYPMEQRDGGWWFLEVMLSAGHHQYRFLVDGRPVLDSRAMGIARNELNETVSVVAVS